VPAAIVSLPAAPHRAGGFVVLLLSRQGFRTAFANVQIVIQSVKHKNAVDSARPAGIGFEKRQSRNSLSAAG
jgi:hypothetical protein